MSALRQKCLKLCLRLSDLRRCQEAPGIQWGRRATASEHSSFLLFSTTLPRELVQNRKAFVRTVRRKCSKCSP